MSAFILDHDHIDLLVSAGVRGVGVDRGLRIFYGGEVRTFDLTTADDLGQILHDANVHSVNYRYNETTPTMRYRYGGVGIGSNLGGALIPWGHVLKAIACYEYQSCEDTATWPTSLAFEVCRAIRRKVCDTIGEESDAPWEWSRKQMEETAQELRASILAGMRS